MAAWTIAAAGSDAVSFSFTEAARAAGLDQLTVYGGARINRYLLETTGCGVAVLDIDGDGWLDVFLVNGTTLEMSSAQ
ncbi:MAG TPA: CRTAC1 family protein, partial [Candidatus Limnocylindria bacterium]|nr:CRTAC1 family protein [Candidatus Limnocylindria bacterium]